MTHVILVVEDNERNLKLLRDVLEYAGFDVRAARTAEDGISLAVSEPPERSSGFLARTFCDQYHCTVPMWCARSRTAHLGVVGTRASRSDDPTTSARRRLCAAMASTASSNPKLTPPPSLVWLTVP